jgi:trehalose 6-phosphate synthase/phosphatase
MPLSTPNPFKRIVVVSHRLPFRIVNVKGQPTLEQNAGGLVSAMYALSEKMPAAQAGQPSGKILWVGKGDSSAEEYAAVSARSERFEVFPVAIEAGLEKKYYEGFCNSLIWPLFHYFPSLVVLDDSFFDSYLKANQLFVQKLREILRPDDFVWIHDYQLFLLPALLREELPAANIGFFLHIPFPSFEIFRIMPRRWGESILRGMLGADVIGFHTYDYSKYFLRTVARMLGHETTMHSVIAEDRVVKVDALPISIDYEKFNTAATKSREVSRQKSKILSSLNAYKLIFSVDRLDYSKGLLHRLVGFECFLETYPQWREKAVFNMVVVPSRDSIPHYQQMKREIDATVGRINSKYSTMAWRPIVYQYKSIGFDELVALYSASHVALITPVRDGMNLVAKEFVACQSDDKGVLILSEMVGAAAELEEALLINPTDKREVAEALNRALTMPERDRRILMGRMQRRVKAYNVFRWAQEFLNSMRQVKSEQEQRKVNLITPASEAQITVSFTDAKHRAIFLDYDGTLVPFARIPELAVPSAQTLQQLQRLTENPANTVILISGRDKNFLEEWFGGINVHLIAEHGAFQKAPATPWQCAIDPDQNWKAEILPVLQRYLDRCNGSFIEEKFSSLVWHYRNVPLEVGPVRAKELTEELKTLLAHEKKLHVMEGTKVVEVKRAGYDKGAAAARFVAAAAFDFILAIGDDRTDEDLFRALPPTAVTIKIGATTSLAKYNLKNQRDVYRLLDKLIDTVPSRPEPISLGDHSGAELAPAAPPRTAQQRK